MGKETVDNWTPIVTTWAIHTYIFGDGRVGVYGIGATSDYIAVQPGYQIRNDGPATGRNDETLNMYVHEYTGTTWKKRTQLRPNGGSICTISDGTDNIRLTFAYSADSGMTLRQEDIETYAKPKQLGGERTTELMRRRRALMAAKKSRLPAEYQEVKWIEGNKAPAIITPVWLTLDTEIETVGQHMERQAAYLMMYGCYSPSISFTYSIESGVYASFGNVFDSVGGTIYWRDDFHKFVQNRLGWWLDDALQNQYNATSVDVNQNRHIAVFARMGSENTLERFSWWRIKYFIVRQSGDDVCHLIPCYRKSDGEIGMYDLVSKTFLANAGTGSFMKGADV